MTKTLDEEEAVQRKEFYDLAKGMGLALIGWQDVEESHFKLFIKMLGAPKKEICSAVYFSIESFESRHKMINRVVHFFLEGEDYKTHRAVWNGVDGGLSKEIKDANENRNKLAHYALKFEVISTSEGPDGDLDIQLGSPKLQPSSSNQVSRLLGRTADKAEHNLSHEVVRSYFGKFILLAHSIKEFEESLNLPPPRQGVGYLEGLGLLGALRTTPPPSTDAPSGS